MCSLLLLKYTQTKKVVEMALLADEQKPEIQGEAIECRLCGID